MKLSSPIVLIDDDRGWRETLSEYLQARGFDVRTAEVPSRGLRLLEDDDVKMAVIDYRMPEMNGLELLRRIRQRGLPVSVVVVSGEDDPALAARLLEAGAQAYLSKGTAPRLLLQKLVRMLALAAFEAALDRVFRSRWDHLLPAPEGDPERN
jgi:DNA-binding response OmpR family regulator